MLKISKYLIIVDNSDKERPFYLIYSTKTGGFCSIEKSMIEKAKELVINPNDRSNPLFNEFYSAKFIVEDSFDEYNQIINFHKKYIERDDILSLTIIPTEYCNFNCPYCFIYEKRSYRMKREMYNSILKFIDNNSKEKMRVKICFFGGEPTLEKDNIINFMKELHNLSKLKHYESIEASMVTNGYLLDKKSFIEYVNSGISDIQITLDGYNEIHNKTRHLKNGKATFDKIWENLINIKEIDKNIKFKIVIRNNFLKNNLDNSKNLVKYFIKYFGDDERFSIYFRPVYYFKQKENTINNMKNELLDQESGINFQKELDSLYINLRYEKSKNRINFFNLLLPIPIAVWCTTQLKNFFVIGSNLDIFKCDTYIGNEDKSVGKLLEDGNIKFNDNIKKWVISNEEYEKCIKCKMLPICQGGCARLKVEGLNNCYWNEEIIKKIMINHFNQTNILEGNKYDK